MPNWKPGDAERYTKEADTPKKQRQWASAANARYTACKAGGGSSETCESSAIAVASAAIKEGAVDKWIEDLDENQSALFEVYIYGLKSALGSERQLRREAERSGIRVGLGSDSIPLREKSVRKDGTIPVKLISPGWGTSGYYPSEILERDGPKVLTKGTQMFWDHPTEAEERERPEGSLHNLAGELVSDAQWEPGNVMGPGLYAEAKIFSEFQGAVDELAPHIGVSIRGWGKANEGEAEGKKGILVEEMAIIQSVDFVTMPGAGGQVMQLFESARHGWTGKSGGNNMDELKELQEAKKELEGKLTEAEEATTESEKERDEAKAEVARLSDALMLRKASDFASEKLAKVELPEIVKTRLIEGLSKDPPLTDEGKLDEVAMATKVEETVKAETEFLAEVMGSGTIQGMGGSGDGDAGADDVGRTAFKESMKSKFIDQGISPEKAEEMADHAARGR